jgi:trimeric autotransporter adhesin
MSFGDWLRQLRTGSWTISKAHRLRRPRRGRTNSAPAQIQLLEPRRLLSGASVEDILAQLAIAQYNFDMAVSGHQSDADADVQTLDAQYQTAVYAASNSRYANDQAADSQQQGVEASAGAAQDSADQAAAQAAWAVESGAVAAELASDQAAYSAQSSALSAAGQTLLSADSASLATYNGVKDGANATRTSTLQAAWATNSAALTAAYDAYQDALDAASDALSAALSNWSGEGGGGYFDLSQDSGYQDAVADAYATAGQAGAAAMSAFTTAANAAWSTYESDSQSAQGDYSSAISASWATCNADLAAALAAYDAALASSQAAYNTAAAAAALTKAEALIQSLAAQGSANAAAEDALQGVLTANQATYQSASSAASAAFDSAKATNLATRNSALAAAEATLNQELASANAAYNVVANDPNSMPTDLADALGVYEAAAVGAHQTKWTTEAAILQAWVNADAADQMTYAQAFNAAVAAQQQADAQAQYTQAQAINAAQKTRLLADSSAEAAYQAQLNAAAETQALADAAATLALAQTKDAVLAAQSAEEATATHTYALAMNGMTKDHNLLIEDAHAIYQKAVIDAETQCRIEIDNAAAAAWSSWGGSAGDPYSAYDAAVNAAYYNYDAAVAPIDGSSSKTSVDADNQWAHDVSSGWLTYYNDMADHAQTYANAAAAAALTLTDALATNAHTFATTVTPAIRAHGDAESANALQAIQTVAAAGEGYTNTLASNALVADLAAISALEAANNATAGLTQAQVSDDAITLVTLASVQADEIGELVEPAPPVDTSKGDFDTNLTTLVQQAGLHGKAAGKELYKLDAVDIDFDCDDFADALQRFLNSKFSKNDGVTISILTVHWQYRADDTPNAPARSNGHAMLVVQHGGQYWYVNPTRGLVGGPYASEQDCHAAVKTHIEDTYTRVISGSVTIGGTYPSRSNLPGESEPWYKSNDMRQRFLDYCRRHKIDPAPFFPPGYYIPPQGNWGASGAW